jgi:hypothetical protein
MKTSQSKMLLVAIATSIFASMTREELRTVARALGVPRGKSGKDTFANLQTAVAEGKCHVKTLGYIYNANDKGERASCIFVKKVRTDKPAKTLFAQNAATPADVLPIQL